MDLVDLTLCRGQAGRLVADEGVIGGETFFQHLRNRRTGYPDIRALIPVFRILQLDLQRRHQLRCGGGHDHAGLAVPALRHVQLCPCLLERVAAVRRQSFDGYHLMRCGQRSHRNDAGANGFSIDMHRTGAAQADTAAVFCTCKTQLLAQHPEQRCRAVDVEFGRFSVNVQLYHWDGVVDHDTPEHETADRGLQEADVNRQ